MTRPAPFVNTALAASLLVLAGCGGDSGGSSATVDFKDWTQVSVGDFTLSTDPESTRPAQAMMYRQDRAVAATTGFVRPATEGATATAAYVNLLAKGDDALIAASAPGFRAVELHTVMSDNGMMQMRRIERLAMPDGVSVKMAPGGDHIMLIGPEGAVSEGDVVPLTLSFESGATLTLDLPVERRAPVGDHAAH